MSPTLLNILTFAAGASVVIAIASLLTDMFLKDRDRMNRRMDREFQDRQRDLIRQSPLFSNLGAAPHLDEEEDPSLQRRWELMLLQAGMSWRPAQLLGFMACGGLGLGAVGFLLRGPVVGVVAGLVAALIPYLYVASRRKKRLDRLLSQLPDAFDLMSRVIRAGQTMNQGMQAVADEFTSPIAEEFAFCFEQQNLGLAPEVALKDLANRTGLLELRIFVLALVVQQQTGGNLAELLDKLSTVIRQRFKIQSKIKTLTAEGRMQALILLLMPPVLLGIILIVNRNYANVLIENPGLLIGSAISELIGALWIRKIVNFKF